MIAPSQFVLTVDIGDLRDCMSSGRTTPDMAARVLNLEIAEDAVVLEPMHWHVTDGKTEHSIYTHFPKQAAEGYVAQMNCTEKPAVVSVTVWRMALDEEGEWIKVDREKFKIKNGQG